MLKYSMYNDKELRDIVRELKEKSELDINNRFENEKNKLPYELLNRLENELEVAPEIFKYVAGNKNIGDFINLVQRPNVYFLENIKETNLKGGQAYRDIKREFSLADKFESITALDPSVDGVIPADKMPKPKSDDFMSL